MKISATYRLLAGAVFAFSAAAISTSASAQAVDDDGAKALFKRNDCAKCHHPNRDKKGPSLQKMVGELKGKADWEARIIKNVTTGPKVKLLDDKKEEEHKIIDTKDEKQIKNLAAWIMKQGK